MKFLKLWPLAGDTVHLRGLYRQYATENNALVRNNWLSFSGNRFENARLKSWKYVTKYVLPRKILFLKLQNNFWETYKRLSNYTCMEIPRLFWETFKRIVSFIFESNIVWNFDARVVEFFFQPQNSNFRMQKSQNLTVSKRNEKRDLLRMERNYKRNWVRCEIIGWVFCKSGICVSQILGNTVTHLLHLVTYLLHLVTYLLPLVTHK